MRHSLHPSQSQIERLFTRSALQDAGTFPEQDAVSLGWLRWMA